MELKEAVEGLEKETNKLNEEILIGAYDGDTEMYRYFNKKLESIETVLKALEEKDQRISELEKMVDLMAEQLNGCVIWNIEKDEPIILNGENEVKQYFIDKAKEV